MDRFFLTYGTLNVKEKLKYGKGEKLVRPDEGPAKRD